VLRQLAAGVRQAAAAHPLPTALREVRPDGWPLLDNRRVRLGLRRLQPLPAPGPGRITSCLRDGCWLGWEPTTALDYVHYRLAAHPECFVAGATLAVAARADAAGVVRVLAGCGSEVHVLQLGGRGLALEIGAVSEHPVSWVFDARSLQAIALEPADPHAMRLVLLLDFLQRATPAEATELALDLLGYPAYFVRWRALQTLAALGHPEFATHLARASADPHPEIAAQASRSLTALHGS
jgi:hypothetical protein